MRLTGADEAFILGPTGDPTPDADYLAWVQSNYLDPLGFTGDNLQAVTTEEGGAGSSYTTDDQQVIAFLLAHDPAIQQDGTDGTWLFGYSQSSTVLSALDSHLDDPQWLSAADPGITAGQLQELAAMAPDLRLVLVGDPAADNPGAPEIGGQSMVQGFDNSPVTQEWLKLFGYGATDGDSSATEAGGYTGTVTDGLGMAGQNTNEDLSSTDVFTVNGDNWAQAQFPLGIPSTSSLEHDMYPGLDTADFSQAARVDEVTYFDLSMPTGDTVWADLWDSLSSTDGYHVPAGADFSLSDFLWDAMVYQFDPSLATGL